MNNFKRILISLFVIMSVLSFFGCSKNNNTDNNDNNNKNATTAYYDTLDESEKQAINDSTVSVDGAAEISDGVYLMKLEAYSGKYVEDGSDKKVKNILSATITNYTSEAYQIYDFSVNIDGKDYTFNSTTLLPNSTMIVLEANKAKSPDNLVATSVTLESVTAFNELPSVMLDTFKISYMDNIINVENISDSDKSDVYVYYKNINSDGIYLGGITYRTSFGSIGAGETVQNSASKFFADSSKIVFATTTESDNTTD